MALLLLRDNPMEIDPSLRIISKKKGVLSETGFSIMGQIAYFG